MNRLSYFLGIIRAPFLVLGPACGLLGLGAAAWSGAPVQWGQFALLLVAAVCAHISVNAFNEYFDFRSGLDGLTRRTPFSGGSGTLPAHPEETRLARLTAWGALALTGLIGVHFAWIRGMWALIPGAVGLFLLVAYTPWLTRRPVLCLLAPGLGFGPLMVMGIAFGLTGRVTWTAFLVSLVPFFLVSDLLLLNQFPDVEADRKVGRCHIPILLGRRTASLVYNLFLAAAYTSILVGVLFKLLPAICLIGLASAALAVPAGIKAFRHADNLPALAPVLGMNVLINLFTPVLVGIGLLIK